jgi:hypothetical protein
MGFGSYDESEQENQAVDVDGDDGAVNVRANEHDGELSFESDASADALVDRLQNIKDDD